MRGGPSSSARPPKSLKARAIGALARREYSRAELRARLIATGATAEDAERVLDEIATLGYLSDARFAQGEVSRKAGAWSRRAIAASLKEKGVAADVAGAALATTGADDHEVMVSLWRRRFGSPPANEREKARQVRFLQSRGFALSAILRLLREPPSPD
jgi:regulatory protein